MTRAAIYARVSRPDETVILENQLQTLRAYVADHDLSPAGEFVDVASGKDQNRAGFSQMIGEASHPRLRRFDLIVFTSLSRMTRGGVGAALEVLRVLESNRVGWAFVEQPLLNNDSDTPKLARDILLSVLAAVDEDYRARISRATRSAYARRKQSAEALGGTVKWGRPRKRAPQMAAEQPDDPIIAPISRSP